jgi:hypothetical protein
MRKYTLFAESTLSSGVDAATATIPMASVASLPSSSGFSLVIYNYTDNQDAGGHGIPGDDADAEAVDVTAIAGTDLTVSRGLYGTTATSHNTAGKTYKARLVWTSADGESSRSARSLAPYGVDTTGTTSAAAALQNAIDDIAALGGGDLYLPIGDLLIDATITVPDGVRLRGEAGAGGYVSSVQASTLVATSAADPVIKQPSAGTSVYGIELRDLRFEGPSASTAIRLDDAGWASLENVHIADFAIGVDVASSATASPMCALRRVRVSRSSGGTAGFRIRGVGATTISFQSCAASIGGGVGFDFNGGSSAVWIGCESDTCATGILIGATAVGDADDCVVLGSRFRSCTVGLHIDGTTANEPRRALHIGNHFTGCTTDITDTGDASNSLFVGTGRPEMLHGAGSPEGSTAAPKGSIYQRTDGGDSSTLYAKTSGVGNTGWRAVTDAAP